MARVLIVDDEPDMREMMAHQLRSAGFTIEEAGSGAEALRRARSAQPGAILLDLLLPEMDGFEVFKALRRDPVTEAIPVLVVSARTSELDRVLAFELGADDYITKPFSPRELVLRLRRSLDRHHPLPGPGTERISVEELAIDLPGHRVLVEGEDIGVTATEFRLLRTLAERRGRVQSREALLQEVWS
ncbi:MAG: response regulator transcription factor, partial [Verrucomicrobiota bacterium]